MLKFSHCALLGLLTCMTATATAATVVTPNSLNGWLPQDSFPSGTAQFEDGPGTPPLGSGSLELNVGSAGYATPLIRTDNFGLVRLDALTALSYSTYVDAFGDGAGERAPYILIDLDLDGDNQIDDQLFFDPAYQSTPVALDTWQTWDALNGGWWSHNNIADAGPGADVKTLAEYLAVAPDARIRSTSSGTFRLMAGGAGSDWNNFVGNVDNLTLATAAGSETYDFELTAVPLPTAACAGLMLSGILAAKRTRATLAG
jgi:hypothetical protein